MERRLSGDVRVGLVPKTAGREKWKQPVVRGIDNTEADIRDSVPLYRS
jgi:hypothetical protein